MNLNSFAAAVADAERKLHSIINFIRAIFKFKISCQSCNRSLISLNFGSAVSDKALPFICT
jgi:hypothetical protein